MRLIFFQITVLSILFSFRCQDTSRIKINPLHPYSSSPYYSNPNEKKGKSFVFKYFFIEGATKVTDALSKQVDSFVIKTIKGDSDFNDFGGYHIVFYRKSKNINENFREQIDGMLSFNLLEEYQEDLLYEYIWADKNFLECDYYKGGKIVKTDYDKGTAILKRNPAIPIADTSKITIKDIH